MQLKNVESLQGILAAKERENIVLKEDLKKADLAMRAEWVRAEEFRDGLDASYRKELDRLEQANRQLQNRLTKLKSKSLYEEFLF